MATSRDTIDMTSINDSLPELFPVFTVDTAMDCFLASNYSYQHPKSLIRGRDTWAIYKSLPKTSISETPELMRLDFNRIGSFLCRREFRDVPLPQDTLLKLFEGTTGFARLLFEKISSRRPGYAVIKRLLKLAEPRTLEDFLDALVATDLPLHSSLLPNLLTMVKIIHAVSLTVHSPAYVLIDGRIILLEPTKNFGQRPFFASDVDFLPLKVLAYQLT